jgi:hypothetical protein
MSAPKYFYMSGGKVAGPVMKPSLPGLKLKGLLDGDMVCEEGSETWISYDELYPPTAEATDRSAAVQPPRPVYIPALPSQKAPVQNVVITGVSLSMGSMIGVAVTGAIAIAIAGLILAIPFGAIVVVLSIIGSAAAPR